MNCILFNKTSLNEQNEHKRNKVSFTTESLGLSSLLIHYVGCEKCEALHKWTGKRDHFLLHYVLKGKGIYRVHGKEFNLINGNFFLVRIGEEVYFEADKDDPWEYCWVGFSGSEVNYLLSSTEFKDNIYFLSLDNKYDEEIKTAFSHIIDCAGNSLSEILMMTSYLYQIFSILIKQSNSKEDFNNRNNDKFIPITEYINNNLSSSRLSISLICSTFSLSSSSLYRLFVSEVGISPIKYIIQSKMKRACELFRAKEITIYEVAYALGYADPLYFSKHFKSYFGISPTEFIAQYRGSDEAIVFFSPHVP